MKKDNKVDKLIDIMYENKWLLIRYLTAALVCSFLRYALNALLSASSNAPQSDSEFISWCFWAIIFYPVLKFFVFKAKSEHIYALLKQIIIYILMCALLWVSRQIFVGVIYMLSSQTQLALTVGGFLNEILCLLVMLKFVFGKFKK